jgi:hypothetical protein
VLGYFYFDDEPRGAPLGDQPADPRRGQRTADGGEYPEGVVRHIAKEYVVGAVHTNTIEGFWSIIKRGIV